MNNQKKPSNTDVLRLLLGPDGPELTCEQCFEELDRYVELELSGADADAGVPGMRAHLQGCPACAEDHRSLRALVATATARPEAPAGD
jgi:anti-sigma factor RsiW